jgi:hypothetical protein
MKRYFITLTALAAFLIPQIGFANPVSSSALIEQPAKYNNKRISFEGEVVGDVMARGKFSWININDDPYSRDKKGNLGYNSGQSVWLPTKLAKKIKRAGGYFWRGDRVLARGVFNRVCGIHGGDMDIHANQLTIVKKGHFVRHPFSVAKALWVLILSALTGAVYALNILRRRKRLVTI